MPFVDRFSRCVSANDPLSNQWKLLLYGTGGPIPKSWFGLPRGLGGASSNTTLPSAVAHFFNGSQTRQSVIGGAARDAGRLGYLGVISYGWFMLGVEVNCACQAAGGAE